MIEISSDIGAWVSIAIVIAMFVLFITEVFPTEVVAIAGVALMLALGLLPYDMALSVFSNTGKRMLPGELLPQTRFTMSYVEDLLRPFNCKTSDIKLLVCYFQKSNDENIIDKMLELLRNCCGGVLPPLTLVPVPHMQTPDSTVEIWGVVQS